MRTISIANFKGGTGKTVTACNLAALLAREGWRVLLIDADAQHNSTDFYAPGWEGLSLSDLLNGREIGAVGDWLVRDCLPGLDLLAADMGLLTLDLASILADPKAGTGTWDKRLLDFLQAADGMNGYDFCLIDCPPSFTAASVAALVVSDEVVLPTRVDAFSRLGALELIAQVRGLAYYAVSPRFRVLVTMADGRSRISEQAAGQLRRDGLEVFETVIHSSVVVSESSYARLPLYEYAPRSRAATDYAALMREILGAAGGASPSPTDAGSRGRRC